MKEVNFKDRVPLHPGRVKLTPVVGATDTFVMERADSPTEEGTPLDKAAFNSIIQSRLTGRFYELEHSATKVEETATDLYYSVDYTSSKFPSEWTVGQRVFVAPKIGNRYTVISNTLDGIRINTILLYARRYELVYNGSSFDATEV